jgi:hypothetical protein
VLSAYISDFVLVWDGGLPFSGVDKFYWVSIDTTILPSFTLPLYIQYLKSITKEKNPP